MMSSSSAVVSTMRSDYDPNVNAPGVPTYSYKSAFSFPGGGRSTHATLSMQEQAELEYELRYRGNMIVDQQRKIQQLEDELRQARDQVDMMNNQLSSYEQDRAKEKKKPQSRYWTPEEHQRFLEALQKYGHKDVKSISMHVSTRNATQVRTHAQKYFLRLERERRKKEDGTSGLDLGYNSTDSFDDDLADDEPLVHGASVSISSLTLPGSPAIQMLNENVGTPPGTPGDSTPGTPGTPAAAPSSPVPIRAANRRRATSFITVAQARSAAQHRESVLVGLPPTWTIEDYDQFMKGLLSMADKQDDVQTLCRVIREQYLPHHSPEEVEQCYKNVLRNIKHKPLAGSPKRRRTNSRPEPLSSSLGLTAATFAPSFPVPHVATTFPFRNAVHSPTSHSPTQNFTSSPSHSPLVQSQSMHSPTAQVVRSSPFAEYGHVNNTIEFPLISDLNLNGVPMNTPPPSTMTTINPMGTTINGIPMNHNAINPNLHHQVQQQQQQHMQQGINNNGNFISSPPILHHHHSNHPITPNGLWGNALPFSFDALMSGNVALAPTLVTHN